MAAALFVYTMQYKPQVEQALTEYEESGKALERRIRDPDEKWPEPIWQSVVKRNSDAYQLFEWRCEGLFMMKPKLEPIHPQPMPPEASHVSSDDIRRKYKELWLIHEARNKSIQNWREDWNELLGKAHESLRQDVLNSSHWAIEMPRRQRQIFQNKLGEPLHW